MSYRIRPGKPLTGEVARAARGQYENAIAILREERGGRYEAIHDARKCFKRLRGLFLLVRGMAPDFRDAENARIRDIAASLSAERDASALVEALDLLLAVESGGDERATLVAIRARLAARRDAIAAGETDLTGKLEAAVAGLEAGMGALKRLRLPGKRQQAAAALASGAARTYAGAVKAFDRALAGGEPADWHELRKRVKYLGMHARLMRDAWPSAMALREAAADRVGDALGEDHDHAVLEALMAAEPDAIGGAGERDLLRARMASRSDGLRQEARDLLVDLLRESPEAFESRVAALWRDASR